MAASTARRELVQERSLVEEGSCPDNDPKALHVPQLLVLLDVIRIGDVRVEKPCGYRGLTLKALLQGISDV